MPNPTTVFESPRPDVDVLPGRSSPSANARQTTPQSSRVLHQDRCRAKPGGSELSLRVAHQHPAYGSGWQSRGLPDRGRRCHLHGALPTPVTVIHGGGRPDGGRIFGDYCQVWQAFALKARAAHLTGSARWGGIVERSVQAQASNERHRLGQEAPATCKEPEASVSGIGYGHDLSRSGHQRLTKRSICYAQSVIFLCRLPRCAA